MYCFTVLVFSLVMIYIIAPRHGRSNPVVYISICSLVGSVSVMAIKGFGVAVKLTFEGNNQFTHPSTYVFGLVVTLCIVVQMNYFNKALDTFSTNVYVLSHISTSKTNNIPVSTQCTTSDFHPVLSFPPSSSSKVSIHMTPQTRSPSSPDSSSPSLAFTSSTFHACLNHLSQVIRPSKAVL